MKERIKSTVICKTDSAKGFQNALLLHICMALLGFISSIAYVRDVMAPFGLSVVAGLPRIYCPSVAIGAFIGYFLFSFGGTGFRYIASLFAILAIKLLIYPIKKLSSNPIFFSVIALLASAITSALAISGNPKYASYFICESILAAAGTFFTAKCSFALSRKTVGLSGDELACLLMSISIVLIGLSNVNIYGISVGKIAAVTLILTVAKYGGVLSGAVSGIAVSFAVALSSDYSMSYFPFSLGGLTAGLFSPFGRYAQCAALLISFITDSALLGFENNAFAGLAEAIIGSILFLLIPKNMGIYLGKMFSLCPKISENKGIKGALNMRLDLAAQSLNEMSSTIEQVSKELSKKNLPSLFEIIAKIEDNTCKGCSQRIFCFEKSRDKTVDAILQITKKQQGKSDINNDAINELKSHCIRFAKLNDNIEKYYGEYIYLRSKEKRIDEIREIVVDNFLGLSLMLFELSKDFTCCESYNYSAAMTAASALQNLDIHAVESSAKTDKFGRTSIMIKVKKAPDLVINKRQIMKMLSLSFDLNFDIPCVTESDEDIYISVCEHPTYKMQFGVNQIAKSDNLMCGDAYSCFNDGNGHFIIMLSDGMGTGGRAAVDSTMTCKLMKQLINAGFGFDCSLKLLNSSMLFKSSDESLATLDIASIDLFTGEVKLYKAGAAPTVVRRNGRTGKAESTSLPIGIIGDISFDTAKIFLKENDILLLLSDGATTEGIEWIKEELECFGGSNAQTLAERISSLAKRRQTVDRSDDITVITAIVDKAV